jgi:hypothetical protein
MIGGRIVSIREEGDRLCLIVADNPYGWHNFLGVDVAKTGHPLQLGDSLWWQGAVCYWTPADGSHRHDTSLPKIGYSYQTGLTS